MNKILLTIVVLSSLLFYAGCGKQEEKKQSKVEKQITLTQNNSKKVNKTKGGKD